MMIKFYCHYLIYKYNLTCSLFWTTLILTNDIKIIGKFLLLGPLKDLFLQKIIIFDKNSTFTQSNSMRAMLEIFLVLFSVFLR